MYLQWTDWAILAALLLLLFLSGHLCKKYIRGVSDYLVAGRSVGRYLGLGSDSMQGMGAVTILAFWQMNYKAGFAAQWWYLLTPVAGILIAITGFAICRFRETRAMTLGQLIEMRHGKRTRVFFGALVYVAGVLNMGIFPAVGAGFFCYYCGFPPEIQIGGGVSVPTVLPIMLVLVGSAVIICFWGGQVTLVVTDFLQSLFVNIMLIGIMVILFRMFSWQHVAEAFQSAPDGDSLLHPFRATGPGEFGKWFFFIHVYYWMVYSIISWSPNTMLVGSARSAHEARMMRVMLHGRNLAMMGLALFALPIAAFVLLHHPDFAPQAEQVHATTASIPNEQVRSQMITPAALIHILPLGMLGAFAGVVMFAFITTHDSYLLAWGGILIQDVIIPLRGKPLSPKQHMMWIRVSVLLVAVFIVVFSLLFRQVDNIFMFMDISASVYTGAAGVVLIGALYWRRGTTTAAWVTMTVGASLSLAGFVCRSANPEFLDGRIMAFWISIVCIVVYVTLSYAGRSPGFNLEEMLNRKEGEASHNTLRGLRRGLRRWWDDAPRADRSVIAAILILIATFLVLYAGACLYNTVHDVPVSTWLEFWHVYVYVMFGFGLAFVTWITVGGFRDLRRLLHDLRLHRPSTRDDGSVEGHRAAR